MEAKHLSTEQDVIDFLKNVNYAKNYVTYQNEDVRNYMSKCLDIIIEILGYDSIDELKAMTDDYEPKVIPGVFNIFYRVRGVSIPNLNNTSWNIHKICEDTVNDIAITYHQIDNRLFKMCRRMATAKGMKFKITHNGCYFTLGGNRQSIYNRIQSAYSFGEDKISFFMSEVNANTVRCYASNLGLNTHRKFRCAVEGNQITIYFKELSQEDKLRNELGKLLNKYTIGMGLNSIVSVVNKFMSEYEPKENILTEVNTISDNYDKIYKIDEDFVPVKKSYEEIEMEKLAEQVRLRDIERENQNHNNNYIDPDDF